MTEKTKSAIRHIITALLAIVGILGLGELTGFIKIIDVNLDSVWEAIMTLVGFIGSLIAFFKDKDRFEIRTQATSQNAEVADK